jgi:hypothetical protein
MDVSTSRLADEKATFAVCEDEHTNRLDGSIFPTYQCVHDI